MKLIKITTHCCGVKTFRFELHKDVPFKPGQYLILTLPINGKDILKAFSISNSPTEKGYIEFTKKITDSDFSKVLDGLSEGAECLIRFPMGRFIFEGEFLKVAFLSGGIGITPIRSIFKNVADNKISSDMILLYSARTPQYLVFKNDFDSMTAVNNNLKAVYVLSDCPEKIEGCRVGRIDEEMVRQEIKDYSERVFFICGPPHMVEAMRGMLLNKLNISKDKIVTEDFVGY